jgi:hypothetical protein
MTVADEGGAEVSDDIQAMDMPIRSSDALSESSLSFSASTLLS